MSKWKQVVQPSHIPILIEEKGIKLLHSVTEGQYHFSWLGE